MAASSTTTASAALRVAEGGLWLSLVGGVVSALFALRDFSVNYLGWAWPQHLGSSPVYVTNLPATLNARGLTEVTLPSLETVESSQGTVDAVTGLPPADIGGPVQATVTLWSTSLWEDVVRLAPSLLASIGVLVGSWLLLRIVRSAHAGEVFTMRNAVRLRWLAAVIAIGGLLHNALAAWGPNWILARSAADRYVDTSTFSISFAPVVVGLVIAELAVIWEHGVRLARDTDGLV